MRDRRQLFWQVFIERAWGTCEGERRPPFLFSPQLVRARYRNFSIFTLQKPAPAKEASILQKQITIT